jgi:hypothetical protein
MPAVWPRVPSDAVGSLPPLPPVPWPVPGRPWCARRGSHQDIGLTFKRQKKAVVLSARREHRFHYDFRLEVGGRLLYIETILAEDDQDDPTIHVVNIHDA